MKGNQSIFLAILLILPLLTLNSCKKECSDPSNPDCENYDPCFNSKPANADFIINEQIRNTDFYYESDTIYRINGTLFQPKYDADSITWLLGSEVVQEKELYRMGYPLGWIDVTMIAKMHPSACLTESERVDTVSKKFFVLPFPTQDSTIYKASPWWGTWEGYNSDNPSEKFTVSFGYISGYNSYNTIVGMDFVGLPKGIKKQIPFYTLYGSRSWNLDVKLGYKALRIYNYNGNEDHWVGGGFALDGVCYREGNKITIDYSYNNTPYQHWLNGEDRQLEPIERVNKTFIANKISAEVLTEE